MVEEGASDKSEVLSPAQVCTAWLPRQVVHGVASALLVGIDPPVGTGVSASSYTDYMSKVDAMQAMREARYAATQARIAARTATPSTTSGVASRPVAARPVIEPGGGARPAQPSTAPEPSTVPPAGDTVEVEELCGHRSMNNRNCRRPAGHAEKNHRYN